MGINMALNLQRHLNDKELPPLHYSNRTLPRGQPLKDIGAVPQENIEGVVENSNIIFTMVSDMPVDLSNCSSNLSDL
jgi:3-hydroxyisobutyrate dehydrogenase-like beta-hydroxyacid dehydrogenase